MNRYSLAALGVLFLVAMPILGTLHDAAPSHDRTVRLSAPAAGPMVTQY
ncbi:hypothetical protein [Pseudooceanicola nitratireducens]|jgi:hypothetical protein|uniref:Uncharacterized protein n=1 Tax=Pseudooceanicola nitratireducens TaxID=517719 RepID=A0A1I1NMV6_9RHOB|nr:hypothetical protein [Pseudooceanicola nitratireducens]MEC7298403.1 hypothetical protein [Pseudomonadota bacterium]MBY6156210.1 hypothetical protein [Pseudooceanicola nitratireducens]MBY6166997.1 hypothetical protein [Pseudooceanicola nitratireducens]MEC7794311.1 hypothetical protein [Pseudomonadota bacterium]MEC9102894.1 hypothetical protein [Pseudomonadota bacterium]